MYSSRCYEVLCLCWLFEAFLSVAERKRSEASSLYTAKGERYRREYEVDIDGDIEESS